MQVLHHGQEIYSFFYSYGIMGLCGIIVTSVFLGIIVYKTMVISKKYKLNSYKELLNKIIKQEEIKRIIELIINVFFISSFYVMIAGFSEVV